MPEVIATATAIAATKVKQLNTGFNYTHLKEKIPCKLRVGEHWVNWITFKGRKTPVDENGELKGYNDSSTWVQLELALDRCGGGKSLGLTLKEDGLLLDDGYLYCLDLDGFVCGNEFDNGVLELVRELGTLTEISPSGTGLKIYFTSDKAPVGKFKFQFAPSKFAVVMPDVRKYQYREIEVFSCRTFLAFTADLVDAGGTDLQFIDSQRLDFLFEKLDRWAKSSGGAGCIDPKWRDSNAQGVASLATTTTQTSKGKLSNEQLGIALLHINADDEQSWSDVANSLARDYGEAGREYWHIYSKQSNKYDFDVCEKRFNRALGELEKRPNGYGTKHLVELASTHPAWSQVSHRFVYWGESLPIETLFPKMFNSESTQLELPLSEGISEYAQGDNRNAQIFANSYRGLLVYVPAVGKWLHWIDSGWKWCELGEQMQYAKKIAQGFLYEAVNVMEGNPDTGKRMLSQATAAQNLNRLKAMLELAKSEPDMAIRASDLDTDPMLLGVENGVVDLRTGALLTPDPSMYITKSCNAAYDKDAECPKWLEFLNQVFDGDKDTIETIQRALGYTLTGMNTEETLFICVGYGSNGKSVFGNTVVWIMGSYAQSAPSSLLVARRADDTGARSDIANLAGCRYVGINELQAGDRLDEQVVKMLAGREPITSRFLYGEFFTFTPQFTPWLRTNHKPIITGTDDGIWRRLAVIPFDRKFSDSEKDPQLEQKLLAESDGILTWMVEGCIKYLHDGGIKLSPKIRIAGASYRKESDIMGEFLEERTEADINGRAERARLYSSWQGYCLAHGYRHGSGKSFGDRLQERGYDKLRSNGKEYFVGLKLRDMAWS